MSDPTQTFEPSPAPEPVSVTISLPARVVADYVRLEAAGIYLSAEEAIRQAVMTSWRFERGSFHHLRLDLDPDRREDGQRDQEADQGVEG